jgi:hypothetical protein
MPLPNFLYIYLIINRILAKRRIFPTTVIIGDKLRSAEFGLFFMVLEEMESAYGTKND